MGPKLLLFDLGETLVSEHRRWALWAQWLQVPESTFFAALGAVIAARRNHREVFHYFRPSFDLAAERAARLAAGLPDAIAQEDLYPDALPALHWAQTRGFRLAIAGNHDQESETFIRSLGLRIDLVGSSERWGVAKPDIRFFDLVARLSGVQSDQIVSIGDRLDNDVLPALRAGLQAIFVTRGPWGTIQAQWPEAQPGIVRVRSLSELPRILAP